MCPESHTSISHQRRPIGRPRRAVRTRMTCYVPGAVEDVLRSYSKYAGIPLTDAIELAVTAYVPYMKSIMEK